VCSSHLKHTARTVETFKWNLKGGSNMVGTTGRVARTVEVQDVKQRGSQTVVEGTHEETITEACIVVGELPEDKLRVVVFGMDGVREARTVAAEEFTQVGG
jgi:hypothetical protein